MRRKGLPALAAGVVVVLALVGAARWTSGCHGDRCPAAAPPPAPTRDGRWRQDIEYLAHELPRLHANAFHATTRPAFNSAAQALVRDVPSLGDDDLRVRLAQLVASIGDAHTALDPVSRQSTYPVNLFLFTDGLFVIRAAPGYERLLGAQVLQIGNAPVEEAYRRASTLVSHENEPRLRGMAPPLLTNPGVLRALGSTSRTDSAAFTFRLRGGDASTLMLPAIVADAASRSKWARAVPQAPLYRQFPGRPFWYTTLDQGRALYLRYADCRDPMAFWKFSREVRGALDNSAIARVVVDFRGNGGGNSMQFDYLLLRGLASWAGSRAGREVVAITDRFTFSSATANVMTLRKVAHARIAGEASGMQPNAYGEVRSLRLPNSRLRVFYATRFVETDSSLGTSLTLEPDLPVAVSSRDFLDGRDPVLEAVVRESIDPAAVRAPGSVQQRRPASGGS